MIAKTNWFTSAALCSLLLASCATGSNPTATKDKLLQSSLADAPFRLTLPPGDWHFKGPQPIVVNSNLVRIAYATNATELRTIVIREQLKAVSNSSLENLADNIRLRLTTNNIKVTETKTNFLGFPARLLAYKMKIGETTLHTETIVLVRGEAGWTIAAIGPSGREEDINHVLTFYSKK